MKTYQRFLPWLAVPALLALNSPLATVRAQGISYTNWNDLVTDWVQTSAPTNLTWTAIASSADGNDLAAAVSTGGIYTSTNGGLTWTQTSAPATNWTCIASSADGSKLAAASSPAGGIWTSTNGGVTWAQASVPINYMVTDWIAITSSSDGTMLAAASEAGNVPVLISTNGA